MKMATCDNGWRAVPESETFLWIIPGTKRHLRMAPGAAGFVLAHIALWFHEVIERLDLGEWDDWGWAWRPIRGTTDTLSNHAGYAMDLNATRHPMGVDTDETFTRVQRDRIHARLKWLRGVVRWGGDYRNRPDAMHWEIVGSVLAVRAVAKMLRSTPRGKRILAANPGAKW
jgi:hypothetical protein